MSMIAVALPAQVAAMAPRAVAREGRARAALYTWESTARGTRDVYRALAGGAP